VVGFDIGCHEALMTNSISTTVVEVTKNIHDTVIMASWQPTSKPTTWQFNFILCQVVKQCHICI